MEVSGLSGSKSPTASRLGYSGEPDFVVMGRCRCWDRCVFEDVIPRPPQAYRRRPVVSLYSYYLICFLTLFFEEIVGVPYLAEEVLLLLALIVILIWMVLRIFL